MSGSETIGVQQAPPPSQPQQVVQNMRLAYSSDGSGVYKPLSNSSPPLPYQPAAEVSAAPITVLPPPQQNLGMNMAHMGESVKKKRGRPRKYGPDGSMALGLTSSPASAQPPSGAFSVQSSLPATSPPGGSASGSSMKKVRGRPLGSSNKLQKEALGSAGIGFTPHILTVKAGEDVSSKIMSFSQNGPRAVCILSANGAISNVTLRQAATSGGTATYEGRFEILSLSGSFLLSDVGGQRSRTGGLSVSLAGPDGRVLGGCVAGLLIAASPVQVIVGSFINDGHKESKSIKRMEPLSAPQNHLIPGGGAKGPSSPPSRGTLSESSGGPISPLNQSTGAFNNSNPQMSSMPWK